MKALTPILVIVTTLCFSPVFAKDWKKELAAPLVTITGNKMVYEDLELCAVTAKEGITSNSFQVKTRSEAPSTKFISRDNFVAITAAMSMAILQEYGELECKDLESAIGTPDLEITLYMTEAGLQIEVSNTRTGEKSRNTVRWEDMFAE